MLLTHHRSQHWPKQQESKVHFGSIHIFRVSKIGTCATKIQQSNGSEAREMRESASRSLGWSNSTEKVFRSVDFGRGLEEGEEEP
jgi:hypothetical protein